MRLAVWPLMIGLGAGSGCATIAHGSRQTVTVVSDPPGARLTVLSSPEGNPPIVRSHPGHTPVQLDLTRRDGTITLRFEIDGCAAVEVHLKRGVSAWTAGNLVYANPLSMQGMSNPGSEYPRQLITMLPLTFGIDFLSGGAFTLPKTVEARLCGR